MPKVKTLRAKAVKHLSAPKLSKSAETEDQNDAEEAVQLSEPTATGILTKKEKRLFRREAFQDYVSESLEQSEHSKSAQRRAKRREKERLAADMSDMNAVLRTVIQDPALHVETNEGSLPDGTSGATNARRSNSKSTSEQIGESERTKPLSKQQRKRALELEQRRLPLILSHPQFMKDPFGTIRTHTSNVLTKTTK